MLTLWFDGLFQRIQVKSSHTATAGLLGFGWVIVRNDRMIARGQGVFGRGSEATSGVAEYLALLEGLDALLDLSVQGEPVEIHGDAKFIIDQMTGFSEVTSESIKPLHKQVCELSRRFSQVTWVWSPRRHNRAADALSRHALRHLLRSPAYYHSALQSITIDSQKKRTMRGFLHLVDLRIYQASGMPPVALPAM